MKWLIFVLTLIFTASFVYAEDIDFSSEFPGVEVKKAPPPKEAPPSDFQQKIERKLHQGNFKRKEKVYLLYDTTDPNILRLYDPLYRKIILDMEKVVEDVLGLQDQGVCSPIPSDGIKGAVNIVACQQSINMIYPGSNYHPVRGGTIVIGNNTFYLTNGYPIVTKIVYQEDYNMAVVPNSSQGGFTITMVVPGGGKAQFVLDSFGIKDIQDMSSIYDIEMAFIKQNVKVTRKKIVKDLLDYYKFLKEKDNSLSSETFITNMLTSIPDQEKFVEFVLSKNRSQSNVNKPENLEKPDNPKKKK